MIVNRDKDPTQPGVINNGKIVCKHDDKMQQCDKRGSSQTVTLGLDILGMQYCPKMQMKTCGEI